MLSPSTLTLVSVSGLVAGPVVGSPVSMENLLPWHGQVITPPSTLLTSQPACVQTLLNALNVPAVGWVMTRSPLMTPPPSGTSAVDARALPPVVPPAAVLPPPAAVLPAGAGSLLKSVPLVLVLLVPQAARTAVVPIAPAPSRTSRRVEAVPGRPGGGSSVGSTLSVLVC